VGKGIHSFAGSRLTLLKLGLASVELSSKVTGSQTIHMHSYVSLIELLDFVHSPPLSSAGERPLPVEGSPPLWDRELGGKLLLGKEKSESEVVEGLQLWSGKIYCRCYAICGGYRAHLLAIHNDSHNL